MSKDISLKRLEAFNDVFADIFDNLLFHGYPVLAETGLSPLPAELATRRTDGQLRRGCRDILKTDLRGSAYRLICGPENQTGPDNTMPERIMGYDFAAYEEPIRILMEQNKRNGTPAFTKRIHDNQKTAPVITLVLYYGEEEWTAPRRLHDMIQFPDDMEYDIRPFVADYPIHLVQVAKLPKEVRERLTSDFRLIADYLAVKNDPAKLETFMSDNNRIVQHPEEFLDVFAEITNDSRYQQVKEDFLKSGKEEFNMCLMLDISENRGREKGLREGLEKGLSKGLENGLAQGIKVFIQENIDENVAPGRILEKLQHYFNLSPEKAKEYYETFSQ